MTRTFDRTPAVLLFDPTTGIPISLGGFDKLSVSLSGNPSTGYHQFVEYIDDDIFTVKYINPDDTRTDLSESLGMYMSKTEASPKTKYTFTGDLSTVTYTLELNQIEGNIPQCMRVETIKGTVSIPGEVTEQVINPPPVLSEEVIGTIAISPAVMYDNIHKWDLTPIYSTSSYTAKGNGNGKIDRSELMEAAASWFNTMSFTRSDMFKVIELYFSQESLDFSELTVCS